MGRLQRPLPLTQPAQSHCQRLRVLCCLLLCVAEPRIRLWLLHHHSMGCALCHLGELRLVHHSVAHLSSLPGCTLCGRLCGGVSF